MSKGLLDYFRRASRPATRRPLLKKGSIRKLFLWAGNTLFMERRRIRNTGAIDFREPIYGHRAPPPLWVFCALVHGGRHRRKSKGFRRMPPTMHDLKRLCLFRRDEVHETPTDSPALPLRPEEVFGGSTERFSKNAPLAGCGTASHIKKAEEAPLPACFTDFFR